MKKSHKKYFVCALSSLYNKIFKLSIASNLEYHYAHFSIKHKKYQQIPTFMVKYSHMSPLNLELQVAVLSNRFYNHCSHRCLLEKSVLKKFCFPLSPPFWHQILSKNLSTPIFLLKEIKDGMSILFDFRTTHQQKWVNTYNALSVLGQMHQQAPCKTKSCHIYESKIEKAFLPIIAYGCWSWFIEKYYRNK